MSKLRIGAAAVAVSVAGLFAIQGFEGKVNQTYADPAHGWAVPTVCVGHTKTAVRGQWRSDKECLELLKEDAAEAAGHVLRLSKVPLTQGELDAYTSFTFNVGPTNLQSSTLLRKLNAEDRVGACNELSRWTRANGTVLPGLVKRRAEEKALCLRDIQSPKNATAMS